MTEWLQKTWDVIVVGAGPAGSTAARVAAARGLEVLLLDKASFPRDKTCGGGLIGISSALLPPRVLETSDRVIYDIGLSHKMGRMHRRRSPKALLHMVERITFDQANVDAAIEAGATFKDSVNVRELEETVDSVQLTTSAGLLKARTVIGADGAGGRVGRYVGAQMGSTDLGLEVEIPHDPEGEDRYTVRLDWGPRPGTYAWVFPKASSLTVGVIERKGQPALTREYLNDWIRTVDPHPYAEQEYKVSGHLTQWRTPGSPLRRGNVILAGETAGLLEPWTREGISFALRSGTWAGGAVASALQITPRALDAYVQRIEIDLEPEIAAGRLFLRLYEKHPQLIHRAAAFSSIGTKLFFNFCQGTVTLAGALRHGFVRKVVLRLAK